MNLELLDNVAGTMILAMLFGSVIGMERQARQRMAGVRTNALVALGAASFVIFSGLFPGEASPTRVSAQIVSGVGFLGAGLIFRDGFSVHGLNTAATLWCSAAVGMMTGAGAFLYAGVLTAVVMFINLALRPIVNWIDLRFLAGQPVPRRFRMIVTGLTEQEHGLRRATVKALSLAGLGMSEMIARPAADGTTTEVSAVVGVGAGIRAEAALDKAVSILCAEPEAKEVRWEVLDSE